VGSWPQAIEHCSSFDWECLRTEYCERLAERSRERWKHWNEVVDEVKKFTIPLVDRKIKAVVREHDLPEIFRVRVRVDITALGLESEFADVCPLGFFAGNSYWYVKGHFPCGWSGGMFPKGRLVIY